MKETAFTDEETRLRILKSYDILDTLPETEYDDLTRLAAYICQTPVAIISLVDQDRQWFKSVMGIPVRQTPRKFSFCAQTVGRPDELLIIPNTRQDARFKDNPLTFGDRGAVFYAGAPLVTPEGYVLGTICVIDHQPNSLSSAQRQALTMLARQVVTLLELRRAHKELKESQHVTQAILENTPAAVALWEPVSSEEHEIEDFRFVFTNNVNALMTGYSVENMIGNSLRTLFPQVMENGFFDRLKTVLKTGTPQRYEESYEVDGRTLFGHFQLSVLENKVLFSAIEINLPKVTKSHPDFHHTRQVIPQGGSEISRLSTLNQALLQHTDVGLLLADEGGYIQTVNPALERLLGYSAEELTGRHLTRLLTRPLLSVDSEIKLAGDSQLEAYLKKHHHLQQETVLWSRQGIALTVLLSLSFLHGPDDSVLGYAALITDLTAIKATERRLTLATKVAGQAVWEYDCIRERLTGDDRFLELFGLSGRQFSGQLHELLPVIHPLSIVNFYKLFNTDTVSATPISIQVGTTISDSRFLEGSALGLTGPTGKLNCLVGVMWEVTEQKKAELTLRESEERFRLIAEQVDEAFWIHGLEPFGLLYQNPVLSRLLEVDPSKEALSWRIILKKVVPADYCRVVSALRSYRRGESVEVTFLICPGENRQRWIQARTFVVADSKGLPVRLVGLATDITRQKKAEQQLQQALQHEQEMSQLKSRFVSMASHQFRTPLATMHSSSELIEAFANRPGNEDKIIKHVSIIKQEIEKYSRLLSDILMLGKLESGRIAYRPASHSLIDFCEHLLELHFSRRPDGRIAELLVTGKARPVLFDSDLIGHVVQNLLNNAFKYSSGNPKVVLSFFTDRVTLEVIDNGIGIPSDDLPHLFEPFYRARNAHGLPGTGMGLAIARQFVELHGGALQVESRELEGSRFVLTLPTGSVKS